LFWVGRYVTAFREVGDVLTVGPPLGPDRMRALGLDPRDAARYANDIEASLGRDEILENLLPAGWSPDLIVAISNFGVQLTPDMRSLDCPRVYISIDTWQCPLDYMDALQFHMVFVAQRSFVQALRATGSRHVFWLPLACEPEAHHPTHTPPKFDISFAGSVASGIHDTRARLLEVLASRFNVHCVANVYGEDYCKALCAGALTFNHAAVKDVNMRVFEAMSMGVPLLTNRDADFNGLFDLFDADKHLIAYDSEADLLDKCDYYLKHPEAARVIAEAAFAEVRANHTYGHRVREILRITSELVPGFPDCRPDRKAATRLILRHVPWGAKRVLDVGLGLSDARAVLRVLGVKEFIGIGEPGSAPGGEWDKVYSWPFPEALRGTMDAALITGLAGEMQEFEIVCARVAESLADGGTILIGLSEDEFQTLNSSIGTDGLMTSFRRMDCHATGLLLDYPPDDSSPEYLIIGRKRSRTLHSVVAEGLANIDIEYGEALRWVETLAPDQ